MYIYFKIKLFYVDYKIRLHLLLQYFIHFNYRNDLENYIKEYNGIND